MRAKLPNKYEEVTYERLKRACEPNGPHVFPQSSVADTISLNGLGFVFVKTGTIPLQSDVVKIHRENQQVVRPHDLDEKLLGPSSYKYEGSQVTQLRAELLRRLLP